MSQGRAPEEILRETCKEYEQEGDPFQSEEAIKNGVEFDPSKLKIDPNLFKSFEEMMQQKQNDPELEKFMASIMEDAARLQESG